MLILIYLREGYKFYNMHDIERHVTELSLSLPLSLPLSLSLFYISLMLFSCRFNNLTKSNLFIYLIAIADLIPVEAAFNYVPALSNCNVLKESELSYRDTFSLFTLSNPIKVS